MSVDLDLALAIMLAVLLAMLFLIAIVVVRGQQPKGKDRLELINERLSTIEQRQDATEHHVNNIRHALVALPTKDVIHRMDLQLTEMSGKVAQVSSEVAATGRAVERIEGYLMNAKSTGIQT